MLIENEQGLKMGRNWTGMLHYQHLIHVMVDNDEVKKHL